ncbi:MAG: envelope stress response membrane protein PspB [Exilibacterium sp.]
MSSFLFVPTILFLTIVAPLWIIMHYRSAGRSRQGLNEGDRRTIEAMLETIDKLSDRIETLESILDEGHPQWRRKNARGE